jgi:acyl-phosphate glycerol 3-phosphate acyltransferase
MEQFGWYVLIVLVGYLIGSIPTAFIVGKQLKGVDLRKVGSLNPGAANVGRLVSKRWGYAVFVLDAVKGALPVLLARYLFKLGMVTEGGLLLAAAVVICGHNWSVFLGFVGGRGLAAMVGAGMAVSPLVFGLCTVFGLFFGFFISPHIKWWARLIPKIHSSGIAGLLAALVVGICSQTYIIAWVVLGFGVILLTRQIPTLIRLFKGKPYQG